MAITEKQAADRIKGIGSSDAAAIIGLSPYMSSHDLWMIKTGRAEGFAGNSSTRRGDILEPAIRDMVAVELGEKVVACPSPFVKGVMRANLDGQLKRFGRGNPVVECKSSLVHDGWGTPGTDEIPPHILIQVTHQMHCADANICYVARLDWDMWPKIYPIEYDRDLADMIEERCNRWWSEHVTADTPPEITNPSESTLKALTSIERVKGSSIAIDPQLCEDYLLTKEAAEEAEKVAKVAKARLLAAVGDNEGFTAPGYKCKIVNVSGPVRFNQTAFKEAEPEMYEKFKSQGSGYSYPRITREK